MNRSIMFILYTHTLSTPLIFFLRSRGNPTVHHVISSTVWFSSREKSKKNNANNCKRPKIIKKINSCIEHMNLPTKSKATTSIIYKVLSISCAKKYQQCILIERLCLVDMLYYYDLVDRCWSNVSQLLK